MPNRGVTILSPMKARTALALVISVGGALFGPAALTVWARAAPDALPPEERQWVDVFVAPIILPQEKKIFLSLTEPYQREIFKQDFWARREEPGLPPPLGPGYRRRYEELRQLADDKYDGWRKDAGRMVLRWGEPGSVFQPSCGQETFRDLEIWTYNNFGTQGRQTVHFIFYRPSTGAARRLWTTGTSDSAVFLSGSCRKTFDSLALDCRQTHGDKCFACQDLCEVYKAYEETKNRESVAGGAMEGELLFQPPAVTTEGIEKLKDRWATIGDSKAKALSVEGPSATTAAPASPAVTPGAPPSTTPAGTSAARKVAVLTASERAARLKALPDEDRKWLEDYVAPIILADEANLFLQLTEPHEREIFEQEFWTRREQPGLPDPLGPSYHARYDNYRELAQTVYDGLASDAGRLVVRQGEPTAVQEFKDCTGIFRQIEVWTYFRAPAGVARTELQFLFYRPTFGGPRKLWYPGVPESDLLERASHYATAQEACRPPSGAHSCDQACVIARIVASVAARGASEINTAASAPPAVPTEDLGRIAEKFPNVGGAGAKALSVEGPPSAAATAAPGASGPVAAHKKLSHKEISQLTDALPQKYKDFLTLVSLIINDDEREVFLEIHEDYQRDQFIEAFWKRRSMDAQGLRTDYKATYVRRVEQATELFKDLYNDRAKVFVLNGGPDAVIPIECNDVYVPIQIWYYERLESLKSKVYLIFYKQYGGGPYKLWLPLDGRGVLLVGVGSQATGARIPNIQSCFEWRTVEQAISATTAVLGTGAFGMLSQSKIFQPPVVETEGVDQILSMTTDVHTGAVDLAVGKLIRYPEMRANKLAMDLSLLVPKAELKPRALGEESFYNVDIVGEIVKDDRLMDNFKYRFDIPVADATAAKIPLTIRRYLYPGEYKLVLKISDGNQNAEGRLAETLNVPEQADAPTENPVARADGKAAIDRIKGTGLQPSTISILPVAKEIATGLQRFETRTSEGVRSVDFYLNGAKVMTRTKAPFEADLNLGALPRKQTVRVVAFGATGKQVGEDEYIVNEGREVFRVRILSPEKGSKVAGPTKVVADASVPEGKALQKMEFYSNETRVATLYQPPFEQTVAVKDSKSLGYVRVIGTLDDGTVAEDLRYVNAPQFVSEVTVDAVEIFATVTDKGRPVSSLDATHFKIFEDSVAQKIEGFEYVKNLPLSIGVMIDTSASMLPSLPDAEQAALQFLDYSIGAKDRAFVVSFSNEPSLLSKLTGRKDKLTRALSGLRAEGSTALYDAIIYGLYEFTGVKGKKALVILTDGKDTSSKFDYETMLEYVRKSGIAVYGIGLRISGADLEVKSKLNKIAQATGGQTFYINSVSNLEAVYRQINDDLRSQYLLTYYSSNNDNRERWRKVEVKVDPPSLQARTISGYYP